MNIELQRSRLKDQTTLVQIGEGDETEFTSIVETSDIIKHNRIGEGFPVANVTNIPYTYMEAYIVLNANLKQISRKTDSLLDWLGDCGGLLDGLNFIGTVLSNPYSTYALHAQLA